MASKRMQNNEEYSDWKALEDAKRNEAGIYFANKTNYNPLSPSSLGFS